MPLTLVFKRLQVVSSKPSHFMFPPPGWNPLYPHQFALSDRSMSECPETPVPVFLRRWSRTFLSGFTLPIYSKSQSPASWSHPRLLGRTELSENQEREFRELRGIMTGNARWETNTWPAEVSTRGTQPRCWYQAADATLPEWGGIPTGELSTHILKASMTISPNNQFLLVEPWDSIFLKPPEPQWAALLGSDGQAISGLQHWQRPALESSFFGLEMSASWVIPQWK